MPKYVDETGLSHFWESVKEAIGHVTPQMFGAKGDGSTDDLAAFQSMLEYAEANNTQALVPSGSYVLSECVFSDDSIVIEDNGTYTNSALVVSKDIKADVTPTLEKVLAITQADIVNNGRVLQGACYDSTNDRIVMAFARNDNEPAYLAAYDTTFTTELAHATVEATSHFNDLTYNPKTHLIYVPARPTVDTIYTINPDTLAITGSFTIDFGGIIKRFSYDPDNDVYFAGGDDYVKAYDSSFNQIESFSVSYTFAEQQVDTGVATANILRQASAVIDGNFVMMWGELDGQNFKNVWLTQFDYANGTSKRSYVFNPAAGYEESESMFVMGGKLYVLSAYGKRVYVVSAYLGDISKSYCEPVSETAIAVDTDMNDIIRYGEYVCPDITVAASLTNAPFNIAFRLYVFKNGTGSYLTQVFVSLRGEIYVRYYRHDTMLWYEKGYVEFLTSSGTSNSWHYKSYSDGTMSAWISYSLGKVSNWTASNNLYYSNEFTIPLPAFDGTINTYSLQASATQQCYVTNTAISGKNLKFCVVGPLNIGLNVIVRLHLDVQFA